MHMHTVYVEFCIVPVRLPMTDCSIVNKQDYAIIRKVHTPRVSTCMIYIDVYTTNCEGIDGELERRIGLDLGPKEPWCCASSSARGAGYGSGGQVCSANLFGPAIGPSLPERGMYLPERGKFAPHSLNETAVRGQFCSAMG